MERFITSFGAAFSNGDDGFAMIVLLDSEIVAGSEVTSLIVIGCMVLEYES